MSDKEKTFGGKLLDSTIGLVPNLIGMGIGFATQKGQDRRQLRQQEKLQNLQIQGQKQMADYMHGKQMQLWKETNYAPQVEQMKLAGLNPALMYGMGGGGGATAAAAGGNVSGGTAAGHSGEIQGMGMMAMQAALLKAQKENIEADTAKKRAEVPNVEADTENKVLQQVITKYMGEEAKERFELVTSPNRSIEADTYQTELEARKGVAGTIYELWTEGKLKDKSVAEIEQILLQNAKTREETRKIYKDMELLEEHIKGAKIDNIINELEMELQTQTGIDRNSPAWMKVLGRLFVTLFGK